MTCGAVHRMGTLSRWRRWMATGFFLGCSPRAVGRAYTPDGFSDRRESIRAVGRGYTPDGFSGRGRDGARREIKSRRARRPDLRGGQGDGAGEGEAEAGRSEEHTSELQSLMRNSYAALCLKQKKYHNRTPSTT